MAKVQFDFKEVIDALPREPEYTENPGKTGSARAWQVFDEEAAVIINDTLVALLTEQPVEIDFQNIEDDFDGFNGRLSSVIADRINKKLGKYSGFMDTEPRNAMHFFVKRLFGDHSRY